MEKKYKIFLIISIVLLIVAFVLNYLYDGGDRKTSMLYIFLVVPVWIFLRKQAQKMDARKHQKEQEEHSEEENDEEENDDHQNQTTGKEENDRAK